MSACDHKALQAAVVGLVLPQLNCGHGEKSKDCTVLHGGASEFRPYALQEVARRQQAFLTSLLISHLLISHPLIHFLKQLMPHASFLQKHCGCSEKNL